MYVNYLTEQHVISKSNPIWKELDGMCLLSKNLYNYCLYKVKTKYQEDGKFLRYSDLEKILREENHSAYFNLPSQTSQQIIRLFDKNIKSYFGLLKLWKKDKKSLSGCPKFPKYKDKQKGRNILIFTNQQCKLNDGKIAFPMRTNLSALNTQVDNIREVRVIPNASCYTIEVIYKKEKINNELNQTKYIGIDVGINNLCSITFNQPGLNPILINGKPLKSQNQYFNKKKAKLQSFLKDRKTSNKIKKLIFKNKNKTKNYLHHVSKYILDLCLKHKIGNVVVGYNKEWKSDINMGRVNNQNFQNIPFKILLDQLKYKLEMNGITFIDREESYTSKCSSLDLEQVSKKDVYMGKRVKRGMFRGTDYLINSDVNGSLNILRKEIGDDFISLLNRGFVLNPMKVTLS